MAFKPTLPSLERPHSAQVTKYLAFIIPFLTCLTIICTAVVASTQVQQVGLTSATAGYTFFVCILTIWWPPCAWLFPVLYERYDKFRGFAKFFERARSRVVFGVMAVVFWLAAGIAIIVYDNASGSVAVPASKAAGAFAWLTLICWIILLALASKDLYLERKERFSMPSKEEEVLEGSGVSGQSSADMNLTPIDNPEALSYQKHTFTRNGYTSNGYNGQVDSNGNLHLGDNEGPTPPPGNYAYASTPGPAYTSLTVPTDYDGDNQDAAHMPLTQASPSFNPVALSSAHAPSPYQDNMGYRSPPAATSPPVASHYPIPSIPSPPSAPQHQPAISTLHGMGMDEQPQIIRMPEPQILSPTMDSYHPGNSYQQGY